MGSESCILEQAMSLVDQERSYLRDEQCAYEAFRERVRLATTDSTNATSPSETTKQLVAAYHEEVMETLDYETVYGDTLAESLEEELSPAIAQVFLSMEPLTQRRKRDLLVQTTAAIKRREEFGGELDDERAALETFAEELAEIDETVKKLPACASRKQPFEKLIIYWEVYHTLLERCEKLLEWRQQQIRAAERSVTVFGKEHARNEFLYSELDTRYPVLSVIATMCERIDEKRKGEQSNRSPDRSLQY